MSTGKQLHYAVKNKKAIPKTLPKEDIMKLQHTIFLAAIFLLLSFSTASGNDRAVKGLILGGGSGALVGQAIGHNTESTIIGATVRGIVGYLIGNQAHPHNRYYNHVTTYSDRRHRYHERPRIIKTKYRDYYHHGKTCRESITVTRKHGTRNRIVSTECWREDSGNHRYNRRHQGRFYH